MPPASGPFPDVPLPSVGGAPRSLADLWSGGPSLVLIGHRSCKTTRETLPFVDRIHRRRTRGTVTAVLQDDAPTARELAAQLGLALPIRLEADPYPLAHALDLAVVPTLFALTEKGEISAISEGLRRADLEAFAGRLGVPGPLFGPDDAKTPAQKPG
ncbi:MAG: TlpA family protein disulfide reductase [Vicinamibacteria bacterium]